MTHTCLSLLYSGLWVTEEKNTGVNGTRCLPPIRTPLLFIEDVNGEPIMEIHVFKFIIPGLNFTSWLYIVAFLFIFLYKKCMLLVFVMRLITRL